MYGFLIGANDVANAFASSVSAKSVTLRQAVMIASVCEFGGAVFLGSSVTNTVRSKIFDVDLFGNEPEVLMFGMFTSLCSASFWLFVATYFGLPVSTTHDVVGCILGFALASKGFSSIHWNTITKIFVSCFPNRFWIGRSYLLRQCQIFVMKAEKPFERAYYTFPIVLTIGIGEGCIELQTRGKAGFGSSDRGIFWFRRILWRLMGLRLRSMCQRRIETQMATKSAERETATNKESDVEATSSPRVENQEEDFDSFDNFLHGEAPTPETRSTPEPPATELSASWYKKFKDNTVDQDLHAQAMHESAKAQLIWDNEEQFDEGAENLFNYQVFTASLNSFAHGANDVANTIAPMSAVINIYMTGEVSSNTGVPKWMLAYGGFAIVMGLLLFGYRVMKSLGYKLTMLSASRGSSAELGSSLTVVTASFLGIPVSSTQCIVGAVTAVGLIGGRQAVDWLFFVKICCSWAGLFFMAVTFSAGFFSFCYYSPSAVYPAYQDQVTIAGEE
ncbi:LOW QUALITY PROTEIN: hypothetical protein ACHAXA_007943 [Cyclostephanos tholiformis]|uniref:Phosphate transporter n=1 Tax=Cyclostephanos tholiformis TaxID=382380 RepID=A0ABD3R5A4_9STRA